MDCPAILIGYAIGSLPIGYLVAQGAGGVDLRRVGSGNVGATNVYRTSGLAMAIAVMLADMAKGAAAVLLAAAARTRRPPAWPRWSVTSIRCGCDFAAARVWPPPAACSPCSRRCRRCLPRRRSRSSSRERDSSRSVRLSPRSSCRASQWLTPGLRAVDIGATIVAALILFRHRGNMVRLWSRHRARASGT